VGVHALGHVSWQQRVGILAVLMKGSMSLPRQPGGEGVIGVEVLEDKEEGSPQQVALSPHHWR